MRQLLLNSRISLITYKDNINFPTYREDKNLPLLTNTSTIDLLEQNYNTSNGDLVLIDSVTTFNKCHYVSLISNDFFYLDINNTNNYIQTKEFNYHNLNQTIDFTLFNGTYNLVIDPVTSQISFSPLEGHTKDVIVQYFTLRGL